MNWNDYDLRDTGDFRQMRDDDLEREMEWRERREMQDPAWSADPRVCTNRTGSIVDLVDGPDHDSDAGIARQAEISRKSVQSDGQQALDFDAEVA